MIVDTPVYKAWGQKNSKIACKERNGYGNQSYFRSGAGTTDGDHKHCWCIYLRWGQKTRRKTGFERQNGKIDKELVWVVWWQLVSLAARRGASRSWMSVSLKGCELCTAPTQLFPSLVGRRATWISAKRDCASSRTWHRTPNAARAFLIVFALPSNSSTMCLTEFVVRGP